MYSQTTEIWDRIEDLLDDVFVFDGKPLQILMQISEVDGLLVQNPTPLDNKNYHETLAAGKISIQFFFERKFMIQIYSLEHILREKVSGYCLRIYPPGN